MNRRRMKRSYLMMRSDEIGEYGPSIGRCEETPIYEWVRLARNPRVKYEFAGLAPSPLPGTLYDPRKTVLALVLGPGLAYEAAIENLRALAGAG